MTSRRPDVPVEKVCLIGLLWRVDSPGLGNMEANHLAVSQGACDYIHTSTGYLISSRLHQGYSQELYNTSTAQQLAPCTLYHVMSVHCQYYSYITSNRTVHHQYCIHLYDVICLLECLTPVGKPLHKLLNICVSKAVAARGSPRLRGITNMD